MKIIKRGDTSTQCRRCRCVMEYDADDIRTREFEDGIPPYFSRLLNIEYINCPQCGEEIIIDTRLLQNDT